MKKIFAIFLVLIFSFPAFCQSQTRQRNTIYVFDCTGSMTGYNGAPDIWAPTKAFLKSELEKEAKENPTARVTILPFQDKLCHPIVVDLKNIGWPNLEKVLDNYTRHVTATNICDSWRAAESYVDQTCDNYIVLLTDGHDNMGGSANEAKRTALLAKILRDFCEKYRNTNGFYVELTQAAMLPPEIEEAINDCNELYKIDAKGGIPTFGCASEDVINLNTRDLPTDIVLGFSNPGTFNTSLIAEENPFVRFSIKDNKISRGKIILHAESKYGDDINLLNKAIDAPSAEFGLQIQSDEIIITNPDINVVLHTTPLRTLNLAGEEANVNRTKPFLWIKGNPNDTLRWNLSPTFDEAAAADKAAAMFRLRPGNDFPRFTVRFNGEAIPNDSILCLHSGDNGILEIIIPQDAADEEFNLTLNEINVRNLDRINGKAVQNAEIALKGRVETSKSLPEIVFWCIIALIVLALLLWFCLIRNQKYPKFKSGVITVQSPYYGTIRTKGYRKIVFTPKAGKQGFLDRLFKGAVLYHVNAAWPCEAEVTPSGRNKMHFRCPAGILVCSPQPLMTRNATFDIMNTTAPTYKIVIKIN